MTRPLCLALLLAAFLPAQRRGAAPSPAAIVSASEIVIDGERIPLPQAKGDWFSNGRDAHASLTLQTAAGSKPVTLDVAWFGTGGTEVINAENDTDVAGDHVAFFLRVAGGAAKPRGDQSITVTVARLDDHDLDARIAGAAEQLKSIEGTIKLHRTAPPVRPVTGKYGECDNVVWDKLYGAEWRSPSECENLFAVAVRKAMQQAAAPVVADFSGRGWIVDHITDAKPITGIARKTETLPFRIDFASDGGHRIILKMSPRSTQYEIYRDRFQTLSAKLKEGGAPALQEFVKFGREMANATELSIGMDINFPSLGIVNFHADHEVMNVPGAAYAIRAAHAQAPTGGAEDSSVEVAWVLLGKWTAPAIQKESDGSERITVKAVFDRTAPTLAVQNLRIRIQGSADLVRAVLSRLDLAPLLTLLRR